MRYLLDTHVLFWLSIGQTTELSEKTLALVQDQENQLLFSSASVWEVAIKNALGKPDFKMDPNVFLQELTTHGYTELPISARHTAAVSLLPYGAPYHKDPFDRLLLAQAGVEGVHFLTVDREVMKYEAYPRLWAGKEPFEPSPSDSDESSSDTSPAAPADG